MIHWPTNSMHVVIALMVIAVVAGLGLAADIMVADCTVAIFADISKAVTFVVVFAADAKVAIVVAELAVAAEK